MAETAHHEELSPDGSCLGLALLEVLRLRGIAPPPYPMAELCTVGDAIKVLSDVGVPRLLLLANDTWIISWLRRWTAKHMGVGVIKKDELPNDAIVLCMRSLRQLYGVTSPNMHTVLIHQGELYDPLQSTVKEKFPQAQFESPEKIVSQLGVTLVI